MSKQIQDRIVFLGDDGPHCVSSQSVAMLSKRAAETLSALCDDLRLGIDLLYLFGGVPVPVAKAILRNLHPAMAAINEALAATEGKGC